MKKFIYSTVLAFAILGVSIQESAHATLSQEIEAERQTYMQSTPDLKYIHAKVGCTSPEKVEELLRALYAGGDIELSKSCVVPGAGIVPIGYVSSVMERLVIDTSSFEIVEVTIVAIKDADGQMFKYDSPPLILYMYRIIAPDDP